MSDQQTAIVGLKRELKQKRAEVRELQDRNTRWRELGNTLKTLAGLTEAQYSRLLNAASLPIE
ncbi:hypothetical protein [Bradyrhizobium sp.]|uniref:hypothetical protein n=1 Tax=Bradyrhizobium sp. TaxID=376 RepID=UPI002D4F01A6|nr:hypothetical protein [Bradyrhizobium sp.]HZR74542.1 hypothetical protein [Bradyrhizobium sp.]